MGLQNALFIKDVSFTSDEAVEFNDEFMKQLLLRLRRPVISQMSVELTLTYRGSKWDRGILRILIQMLEEERGEKVEAAKECKDGLVCGPVKKSPSMVCVTVMSSPLPLLLPSPISWVHLLCIEANLQKYVSLRAICPGDFMVLNRIPSQ